MFDLTILGVWISDETLIFVFDITLPGVWISNETLLSACNTLIILGVLSYEYWALLGV